MLASLRAAHPEPPRLQAGDHRVHSILRDLDKVKGSKPKSKLKRCEQLIYFIVQSLRKCNDDHLLHTTSIWVLISLFRMFPRENKLVMLQAGVAGVLYNIIKSGSLNGSSRQYASELCFYLSSNFEYPDKFDDGKPLQSYPEVQPFNKYQSVLDDVSIASISDISTSTEGKPSRQPFVPYRIDKQNLAKMEALFTGGYENEVAASLPKISMLSSFGFSQHDENNAFEDDDDNDPDDGDSVVSNLSSGSYSVANSIQGKTTFNKTPVKMGSYAYNDASSVNSFGSSSMASMNSATHRNGNKYPNRPFTTPINTDNIIGRQSNIVESKTESNNLREQFQPWLGRQPNNQSESSYSKPVSSAPHRMIHQLRNSHFQDVNSTYSIGSGNNESHHSMSRPFTTSLLNPSFDFDKKSSANPSSEMDILNFMNTLDPFSNKKKSFRELTGRVPAISNSLNDDLDGCSLASDVDSENEEDEDCSSDSDNEQKRLVDNDGEDVNVESNVFLKRQKMRIRAEKLIDHRFVKALFVKKMSPEETRNLIYRMGNIIQLIDPENTGYITFEQFMKIVLSVAPSHLQRKDIVNFFQYQTDNMQNLLDYQEFLISGKVLLLTKAQQVRALKQKSSSNAKSGIHDENAKKIQETITPNQPTTLGWLKRQKEVVGEESTYTWKNHIKWFQRRQGSALIWLIRRSVRALDYESTLLQAQRYLLVARQHALALDDLLHYGRAAIIAQTKRQVAKVHLLKRSIHARKYLVKQLNAFQFLKFTAIGAKKEIEYYEKMGGKLTEKRNIKVNNNGNEDLLSPYEKLSDQEKQVINEKYNQQFYNKLQSVNYNKFYKIKAYQQNAIKYLQQQVVKAKVHCTLQDDSFLFFQKYVHKVQLQLSKQSKIRYELYMYGNRGLEFCLKQDDAILGLMRFGTKALNLMNNQLNCLDWLLHKGRSCIQFLSAQSTTAISLVNTGRKTLAYLNNREDAFTYLTQRCSKAIKYVEKKKEATSFLLNASSKIWKLLDDYNVAVDWLQARAKRGKEYIGVRQRTFQYLQFIAHKASATARKSYITQQELLQIGIASKLQSFQLYCKQITKRKSKLLTLFSEEKRRIRQYDKEQTSLRNKLMQNIQTRWKENAVLNKMIIDDNYKEQLQQSMEELLEKWTKFVVMQTFQILASYFTPSHAFHKDPLKKLEGIVGNNKEIANNNNLSSLNDLPLLMKTTAIIDNNQLTIEALTNNISQIPFNIIGKYGLRKLLQNGKLLGIDVAGVDEIFRNHDYNSSCYIPMGMILPYIMKRLIQMKSCSRIISNNDLLSIEERAFITVFQLCQQNQTLLDDDGSDVPRNRYDEFRKQMNFRKGDKQEHLSDNDSDEDEDDEFDFGDDDIFSDIEKLKRMDVGKLMKYLTKRTHEDIAKTLENNKPNLRK